MIEIQIMLWALPILLAITFKDIKNDVPKEVLLAFDKKFKLVIGLEWSSKFPVYTANFISEGKKCYASFNEKGLLVEEGTQILASQIGQDLIEQFSCWVPHRKITEYFIVDRKYHTKAYLCKGKSGNSTFEALFSDDGELIRHERYKSE